MHKLKYPQTNSKSLKSIAESYEKLGERWFKLFTQTKINCSNTNYWKEINWFCRCYGYIYGMSLKGSYTKKCLEDSGLSNWCVTLATSCILVQVSCHHEVSRFPYQILQLLKKMASNSVQIIRSSQTRTWMAGTENYSLNCPLNCLVQQRKVPTAHLTQLQRHQCQTVSCLLLTP